MSSVVVSSGRIHEPVMADEVLEHLDPRPDSTILDLTVGAGGHAARILEALGEGGRVIGADRDAAILAEARNELLRFGDRVSLHHARSDRLRETLRAAGAGRVQGILLDLGVSSPQLDDPARGFSFQREGKLDMRMDQAEGPTALDILAGSSAEELERILREYGEEPFARRIAGALHDLCRRRPPRTTTELAAFVATLVPPRLRGRGRVHPSTRVFQALRIATNRELEVLERTLPAALDVLDAGGRMVVISFHSLEDRIVKNLFRDAFRAGRVDLLTRKPLRPTAAEVDRNPRARSACLRAVRKPVPGEPRPRRRRDAGEDS